MLTLKQVLEAITDRKEFAVIKEGGLVTINYLFQGSDSFEGIRANLRGIVFDEATGRIVSLPFHKFFAINQTEQTQLHKIAHLSADIYEKLDGSMIHFFQHEGQLCASTRMSRKTPQAVAALKYVLEPKNKKILHHIEKEITEGRTPIFEYVSPQNQVVVVYSKAELIYLASRDRRTGKYSINENFSPRATRFEFPFSEIMSRLNERENFEGFVCWLDSGIWVKAKSQWYLDRHHALDALMRPKWKLFEIAFQGFLDDVIASAVEKYQPALRQIQEEASRDFIELCLSITKTAEEIKLKCHSDDPKESRKQFALYCQKHHPGVFSLLMAVYVGKEITKPAQELLLEKYRAKYPDPVYAAYCDSEPG